MKKKLRIVGIAAVSLVFAVLFAAFVIAFSWSAVNNYIVNFTSDWGWDREKTEGIAYFSPRFSSEAEANANSREVAIRAQAEGTVLLKNDGALPLGERERRVSVFGAGSVALSYGGTGSGEGNGGAGNVDFYTALEESGFSCNPALADFYKTMNRRGYRRGKGTDMNGAFLGTKGGRDFGYSINEVERGKFTRQVRDSYASYGDAALVVISRSGGEGQDLPTDMSAFYEGDHRHYLELTEEETSLFEEVRSGGFGKVIVLLNTLNPFEVSFLEEEPFGVSAALWIGGTGQYGAEAAAKILTGELSPEGRLPDTYPRDLLSAPAMRNYGDNRYTENGQPTSAAYVAYEEGIYVGYRYFETRYFDAALGKNNAGAADEIVYPFGYGLGYTLFTSSELSLTERGGALDITLTVENVGTRAGRETVELYLQKPYTEYDRAHGVEKSATELVGFCKTKVLGPGEREEVTLSVKKEQLASYDAYGCGTYLLEGGDYLFSAARNAREATEEFLAVARGERAGLRFRQETDEKLDVSGTGYPIENRFETEHYTSRPADMPLVTRADWAGTFPTVYGGGQAGRAEKPLTEEIKAEILDRGARAHLGENTDEKDFLYHPETGEREKVAIGKAVTSSGEGLNFIDLVDDRGKPYDYEDPRWMALVRCMSADELYLLCSSGYGQSPQIDSINKRRSITSDSPMGLHCGTLFPCYPIQAATFDPSVAEAIGDCIAEEALWNDVRGYYSPACNMHRTPFGGRNYEYYSEDPLLSGKYAAAEVRRLRAGGLYVHLKHFALNDQDTNRGDRGNFRNFDPYNGLCTYSGEQAIREMYLNVFRIAVEEGGANGVMTSYNRIGNTWAGGHHGLLTEVLRNEWGMRGIALTDYAGTFGYTYMNMNQGLRAGNSQWLHPSDAFPIDDRTSDAAIYYLQKAAKDILYAEASSSRVNNQRLIGGASVQTGLRIPAWKAIAISAFVLLILSFGAFLFFALRKRDPSRTSSPSLPPRAGN